MKINKIFVVATFAALSWLDITVAQAQAIVFCPQKINCPEASDKSCQVPSAWYVQQSYLPFAKGIYELENVSAAASPENNTTFCLYYRVSNSTHCQIGGSSVVLGLSRSAWQQYLHPALQVTPNQWVGDDDIDGYYKCGHRYTDAPIETSQCPLLQQ